MWNSFTLRPCLLNLKYLPRPHLITPFIKSILLAGAQIDEKKIIYTICNTIVINSYVLYCIALYTSRYYIFIYLLYCQPTCNNLCMWYIIYSICFEWRVHVELNGKYVSGKIFLLIWIKKAVHKQQQNQFICEYKWTYFSFFVIYAI